jgi:hypothetical protein
LKWLYHISISELYLMIDVELVLLILSFLDWSGF